MESANIKYPKGRKSLAIDVDTYNLLQEMCNNERRSKIDQLKILIESAHRNLAEAVAERETA